MTVSPNYKRTLYACFTGYVVQAIVNNFITLLFLTIQDTYDISLSKITLLITFNFMIQLTVDLAAPLFVDRIGYHASILAAHVFSVAGLVALAILPDILPNPLMGFTLAVTLYAIGGGLLEVLVSPIADALPTPNKAQTMSLLHSFYCWGHVAVVLLSTLFFAVCGITNWRIMSLIWAIVPLCNFFLFLKAPLPAIMEESEQGLRLRELLKTPIFWILFLTMFCAGASEQSVSQWASTFAEQGLNVNKTVGDLAGPMFFAVLMGLSRLLFSKSGNKLSLYKALSATTILCIFSYLMISFSPHPALSLLGCGICGFSVGLMWPGTYSMAARLIPRGGTLLFAFLALAGDVGCSGGPTLVAFISEACRDNMKAGIAAATIFPVFLLVGLLLVGKKGAKLTY